MTFTMDEEVNNGIIFLDITVSKIDHKISFNMYRRPTAIDIIIPDDSCHRPRQKLTAIRHLINRHNDRTSQTQPVHILFYLQGVA
jgi:hypothetical protein